VCVCVCVCVCVRVCVCVVCVCVVCVYVCLYVIHNHYMKHEATPNKLQRVPKCLYVAIAV